jgi:hypothetical protein
MFYTYRLGAYMSRTTGVIALALFAAAAVCSAQDSKSKPDAFTVVFKDGHQKTFSLAEGTRIEFSNGSIVFAQSGHQENISVADISRIDFGSNQPFSPGRNHFVGKWKVGTGVGGSHFFITLEANGQARKTLGSSHGTWTIVNGEARISWDDGWRDIIRKVGEKHEKMAFEPGRSFDQAPSNITDAVNTTAQPI